jgi:lactoylglutathione lyase
MQIEHVAIWVTSLAEMRLFYIKYFGAQSNDLYYNSKKEFYSYFLSFNSGARVELMYTPTTREQHQHYMAQHKGLVHLAFKMGSREMVDKIIATLDTDGYKIVGQPRITGDGYYEGVFLDPEGNIIEVVA